MSLFLMAAEVPKGSSRSSPGRSQDTKKKNVKRPKHLLRGSQTQNILKVGGLKIHGFSLRILDFVFCSAWAHFWSHDGETGGPVSRATWSLIAKPLPVLVKHLRVLKILEPKEQILAPLPTQIWEPFDHP